jgi:hypothetical protein
MNITATDSQNAARMRNMGCPFSLAVAGKPIAAIPWSLSKPSENDVQTSPSIHFKF